ncbi:uncharacterized protein NECHADRAFT_70532 [Fusarium vanettenii 77-13-4]|uniref:NACHT domain-containing protein n=1 Tax=Fusarium vanettenii (strain ATCC MYA-4622 / CBS 123669 / FGSC 9596 / NRRL 45880 / 77-13-4) TaxID=660122 RepID=C7ZA78_FUSV7|nr:uncharacterized protein NECHADRAFT_70532 [Fusarium vanettenii 77-13-4]EEU39226.1 hypothetical protein NECHADRAFT_70532 [Fusarium vanettenii 77-13-4]
MASFQRKRLNSSSNGCTANKIKSLRADGSSRVQVGNTYTEVHNYEGRHADDECLRDLRTTDPRIDKTRIEKGKGGLMQGSYRWVLEDSKFQQWAQETEGCLLWVKGDPGKGKTMLLCGLVDELTKSQHALSYFFCQATDSRINNATSVLRGLIYLLVDQEPSLKRHIRTKWNHGGKSIFDPPNGWHVLCNMLNDILRDHSEPTCLVIDALDECEGSSLSSLLNLIVSTASEFPHVRWLVSSRNLPNIERGLGGANPSWRLDISLEANAGPVSRAVADYIGHKVSNLANLHSETELRKELQETMQDKANGTFLWAALRILATMFLAYRPLRLQELALLADLRGNFAKHDTLVRLVRRCGSFLSIQQGTETVHFVHQSAKDFLRDNKDVLDGMFPSGMGDGHHQLFSRSVKVMDAKLRQNIYGLRNPGVLTSEIEIPVPDPLAAMRYSCVRWLDHFCELVSLKQIEDQDGGKEVATFLQRKYLYWLEALGLCGSLTEGILSIRKLEALATRNQWGSLATLVHDAHRFVLTNKRGIEIAPLQVYVSALIFCPTSSWIREKFKELIPEWIKKGPKIQPEWDACLLTLEGHADGVHRLAFSPDSRIIASGDRDGIIKIWDAHTGACLNTIWGDNAQILPSTPIAVSPDGQTIITQVEHDGCCRIRGWSNPETARFTLDALFPDKYYRVAISSDSTKLVGCREEPRYGPLRIEVWDLTKGTCITSLSNPNISDEDVLAFSPDGMVVAFVGMQGTVSLWHTITDTVEVFSGHHTDISILAISPDGRLLASGCEDKTIKIWDPTVRASLSSDPDTGWGPGDWLLSPNGLWVASLTNNVIRMWSSLTDDEWVTVQGRPVLWIPPQYRPRFKHHDWYGPVDERAVDCNKSGIAMMDNSNRVTYVQFDVPEIVLKF